jgi:hypothetical protein
VLIHTPGMALQQNKEEAGAVHVDDVSITLQKVLEPSQQTVQDDCSW